MGIKPIAQDKKVCPGHKNAGLKPFHCYFVLTSSVILCLRNGGRNLSNVISVLFFFFCQYILTWLVCMAERTADSCSIYYGVKVFISLLKIV